MSMIFCVCVFKCNQSSCLAEFFKTSADQRTIILCVWHPRAREEQKCSTAAGKLVPAIRNLSLMQCFFLATASLWSFCHKNQGTLWSSSKIPYFDSVLISQLQNACFPTMWPDTVLCLCKSHLIQVITSPGN